MNPELRQSLDALFAKLSGQAHRGKTADLQEMQKLNADCGSLIPDWYIEMLTNYPLCGLEFEWQKLGSERNFDGTSTAEWLGPHHMRGEIFDAYPGIPIRQRGFINVAADSSGGGDPYFIPTNHGDNPPLFQVYHDISDDPDEIIQDGMNLAAEKLSDFFRNAVVWIPESSEVPEAFYKALESEKRENP